MKIVTALQTTRMVRGNSVVTFDSSINFFLEYVEESLHFTNIYFFSSKFQFEGT